MPGPRILLLRQARNTAIALETLPLRQTLYYLPPAPKVIPDLRMLRRLLPEITVFITETLRYKQTLLTYKGMRDTRIPLLLKA